MATPQDRCQSYFDREVLVPDFFHKSVAMIYPEELADFVSTVNMKKSYDI